LSLDYVDALVEAAAEDRSTYGFTFVPHVKEDATTYVEHLLIDYENNESVPFVQIDAKTNRVVGSTRFLTIRFTRNRTLPYAVEIGGTWLAASAQRTPINTEAKLLLLDYAFSTWRTVRVDLKTDARNERSRAAMLRLGATFEGVLRQAQPSYVPGEESLFRDTAYFSITESEWPAVREKLVARLK
jgi:RimJ/RimL family protein N-acetyltransferase